MFTSSYKTMKDPKLNEDSPNVLSNRDAIDLPDDASLSESDPDEAVETFSRKVEELSSSSEDEEEVQPAGRRSGSSSFRSVMEYIIRLHI